MSEKSQDLSGALEMVLQALKEKGNTDLGEQLVQALGMRDIVSKIIEKPRQEVVDKTPESIEAKIDRLYNLCRMPNNGLYFMSFGSTGLNMEQNAELGGRRLVILNKGDKLGCRELSAKNLASMLFNPRNDAMSLYDLMNYGSEEWLWDKDSPGRRLTHAFSNSFDIILGQQGGGVTPRISHIIALGQQKDSNSLEKAFLGYGFPITDKEWVGDNRGSYIIFGLVMRGVESNFDPEIYELICDVSHNLNPGKSGYDIVFGVLKKINPKLAEYIQSLPQPQIQGQ